MASINYAARQISVKIVYYGPGLSGKTTNLQVIHKKTPQEHRSDMVSLATETDRTLFFDFLPLDLGKIKGFATKFQLYTVPGQVYYNATRKLVLRGVDGVVFVADSGADKIQENLESFQNLEDNLAEYGYQRESVPIIIQYNKRDLPNALPIEELQKHVNKYNLPYSEGVAYKGVGVFDTLKMIGKIVIDYLNKKYSRGAPGKPAAPDPQAPAGGYTPPATAPMPAYQPPAPTASMPAYQPPTDYQAYTAAPTASMPAYQPPADYQAYAAPAAPAAPVYQPPTDYQADYQAYAAPAAPAAPVYQPPTDYQADYQAYAAPATPAAPVYQPPTDYQADYQAYVAPAAPAAPVYQPPTDYQADYQAYAAPAAPAAPAYQPPPPPPQSFDSFDTFESFEAAPAPQQQYQVAPQSFEPIAPMPQSFEPPAPPPAPSFDPYAQQQASPWAAEQPSAAMGSDPFLPPPAAPSFEMSPAPVFEMPAPAPAAPAPVVNYDDAFLMESPPAAAAPPAQGMPQAGGGYGQPSPFDFDVAPTPQPPAAQAPSTSASDISFDFQQSTQPADPNFGVPQQQFSAAPQFSVPPQAPATGGQSELDLEIERYQREVEEKQKKMRASGGTVGFPPPPSRPDMQEMQPYAGPSDNRYQAPFNGDGGGGSGSGGSFSDFEAELAGTAGQQHSAGDDSFADDYQSDSAMFFTSVDRNTAILKRVNKPPVNPAKKAAQQQQQQPKSFVSKLFGKNQ